MSIVGSLFTGIGGFDLAFEREGWEVAWQCEVDPFASAVLERHWPGALRREDVRWLSGALVDPVDVITFGSPCQDLCVQALQRGTARWLGNQSAVVLQTRRFEMRGSQLTPGEQLGMFDARLKPQHNGTDTSRAAAGSVEALTPGLRRIVLNAIREAHDGLTCDDVERATRLSHQTASARVNELAHLWLIEDSGQRRRTRSGRSAKVGVAR